MGWWKYIHIRWYIEEIDLEHFFLSRCFFFFLSNQQLMYIQELWISERRALERHVYRLLVTLCLCRRVSVFARCLFLTQYRWHFFISFFPSTLEYAKSQTYLLFYSNEIGESLIAKKKYYKLYLYWHLKYDLTRFWWLGCFIYECTISYLLIYIYWLIVGRVQTSAWEFSKHPNKT